MNIKISNIEPSKVEVEKNKLEKLIGIDNIDWISTSDNKIAINIWSSGNCAIRRLREIKDKLRENGFKYAN